MKPLISIIIPSYNNKIHLTRLLRSIQQNIDKYQKLKNLFEVIVVDDGSKENIYNLKKLFKFKYFKKKNGGAASARNYGTKFAKGDFLFFLDSDLEITPNFLIQVFYIIKSKRINVLSFYYNIKSHEKNSSYASKLKAILDIYLNHKNKTFFQDQLIHGQCVIIDRNVFNKTNGWDESIEKSICEHEEYSKRILKETKIFTNFKIGPYHYYKDFISTIREVFERSKIWSQLFYENKVVRDERFKLINILFKFFPLVGVFTIVIDFKIFLLFLLLFYFSHFRLYKMLVKINNINLLLISLFYYPLIFSTALIGSAYGTFLIICKKIFY